MTLRVLHLIKGLGPGGAEQLLLNQARATRGDDIDYSVAYLVPWKSHLVEPLLEAGWEVKCLGSGRAMDLRWLGGLRSLIVAEGIDVVHSHSPMVAAFARVMSRSLRGDRRPALVYTEHNDWRRHRVLTRFLNRVTIRLEDHVYAVSDGVRESMSSPVPVEVLVHGIDVLAVAGEKRHRAEVRRELGIAENETVIGTVANFRREKGYEVMLAAAAEVLANNPDVRFVSVGQGPLEAEIRAEHQRLGLGDRFLLLGYRADATRIMAAFDIFTLSSRHEGLPVALMDAVALQLAIVCTAVGGIPQAVPPGGAILVPPDDVRALADAYQEALVADLSYEASEATKFSVGRASNVLLACYRRLAG